MHLPSLTFTPADAAFRARHAAPVPPTIPPPPPARPLQGHAEPGDVLALPGGSVVQDANRNGFVDGTDDVVRSSGLPWPVLHVDVRG